MSRHTLRLCFALLLIAPVCFLAACAGSQSDEVQPITEPLSYDPAWYPLGEGDVWVYQATRAFGRDPVTNTRVKTVTASSRVAGTMEQLDPEADSYYFTSDADGWRMHGDFKMAEPENGKVYSPPMVYLNAEVLEKGNTSGTHRVTVDGQDTGTVLKSSAALVGWQTIQVPAFEGRVRALKTTFKFELEGSHEFFIENWLVHGVGAVKRTMRVTGADGAVRFTAEFELVAGRVGGRVMPESNPGGLAKILFRKAWENRERFADNFPGLSASYDLSVDGKVLGDVGIVISGNARISTTIREGIDEASAEAATNVLRMQFGHRRSRVFEEQHGEHQFSVGDFPARGVAVEVSGDTMGSRYEVANHYIRVVSRVGGDSRFDVVVDEVVWKRRRYMPTKFSVIYRDSAGNETSRHRYSNDYQQFGIYWVPSEMTFHDGERLIRLVLRDCQLAERG